MARPIDHDTYHHNGSIWATGDEITFIRRLGTGENIPRKNSLHIPPMGWGKKTALRQYLQFIPKRRDWAGMDVTKILEVAQEELMK